MVFLSNLFQKLEDCDEDALEAHDDDVTDFIEAYVAAESAEDVEESVEEEYEAALCRVISAPCCLAGELRGTGAMVPARGVSTVAPRPGPRPALPRHTAATICSD